MIGTIQMFPPNQATRQILILRYLTPMGEYQEVRLQCDVLLILLNKSKNILEYIDYEQFLFKLLNWNTVELIY